MCGKEFNFGSAIVVFSNQICIQPISFNCRDISQRWDMNSRDTCAASSTKAWKCGTQETPKKSNVSSTGCVRDPFFVYQEFLYIFWIKISARVAEIRKDRAARLQEHVPQEVCHLWNRLAKILGFVFPARGPSGQKYDAGPLQWNLRNDQVSNEKQNRHRLGTGGNFMRRQHCALFVWSGKW